MKKEPHINSTANNTQEVALKVGALQNAIFNSANFSSIATDAKGVIQIFNVGAENMLGYKADEVMNKITPADISDPQEVIARAEELSLELGAPITPGFEALVFKASRGIEDIYELTYIRKDGSRFPAVVSVTALRDDDDTIIGYLLIGTDNTARKQAEEALRKAGALQSAIFNSANFSSIATDASGVIQIFNVGAENMLGYKADEVMNKITPADISDPQEVIARAKELSLELGTPITPGFEALVFKASRGIEDIYELTYIRKDGSRFPAVVSVTALRDDDDTIIGYLLIGTDNTARKQAEEALRKAGALQNAIFNSANFSSIATDANGVIQIFNVGAENMLGYKADEVMNKITPADISDPQEVIARAEELSLELGAPITPGFEALVFKASRGIEDIYELTYIRKDGSRFPAVVSVTALRDDDDTIIGYLLIGTDNTARKQIEAEQKQLSQRLRDHQFYTRSLFESNIDAIMTTDPSGIITDVNKQMEVLTDCTRDELIGAPFKNYFTDSDLADKSIKQVLREKKVTDYELTVRTRDGKETVVSFNATTFYDRDRKLQGVFAAARDITERKRLDQVLHDKNIELEGARDLAEKASLAKSDFLSSMSHELRSPLNAILGFAQLMDSDIPAPTTAQKQSLVHILDAGWHLLKLIDEILDLAKVEAGHVAMSPQILSLAEVLLTCQSMVEPQAQQLDIKLIFPHCDIPYFTHADQTRVIQVLTNLLSNAIKYNRKQGVVEVTCTEHSPDRIRVSIRDTGMGLSPEQLSQLFQSFNRLGQESGGVEGTGIGLVVAKRLIELMGGTIGVESTVGVGSIFWFELIAIAEPRKSMALSDIMAPIQPQIDHGTRLSTLLYIEDNPMNMKLVEKIIGRHPELCLLGAVNGLGGVEIAQTALPDLILMDIHLPDISGYEALSRLHAYPATAHIPVIAVSANAMPSDIEKGNKAGFFRYLTKPINVNELMKTVGLALNLSELEVAVKSTVLSDSSDTKVLPEVDPHKLILIAEDNEVNQQLILRQLSLLGLGAAASNDGVEALECWRSGAYALILTDLLMPNMNGYELATAIRCEENKIGLRPIPIIAFTANGLQDDDELCKAAGIDDYLSKPVLLTELDSMMQKWLPETELPVDLRVLEDLVGDDRAFISEFLVDFRVISQRTCVDIETYINAERSDQAGAAAHKLKSSARSVGALKLSELCELIEYAATAQDHSSLMALLPRFKAEVCEVENYLVVNCGA